MKVDDVLRKLKSKGTAQNRKVYARHGYPEDTYGVSFAELRKLAKEIGRDHALARALWKSGNGDARVLASLVADPEALTASELESWVKSIRYYVLADMVSQLAARSPLARRKSEAWRRSRSDHVAQVGWNLVGALTAPEHGLDDDYFVERLEEIERGIHTAPNRTRHAMNMALCAIGGYRSSLRPRAVEVAGRIGKVEVDHGETGCKTPDAASYIARMAAHQKKQASKKTAKKKKAPTRAGRGAGRASARRRS